MPNDVGERSGEFRPSDNFELGAHTTRDKVRLRLANLVVEDADSFLARVRSNFRDFLAGHPLKNLIMRPERGMASPSGIWENEGWRRNPQFTRVEALSITLHVTILALLVIPLLPGVVTPNISQKPHGLVPESTLVEFLKQLKLPRAVAVPQKPSGGGGGGDHNPLQEGTGVAPLFSRIPLVPPTVKTQTNPQYPVQPKILGPEDMKILSPELNVWGNPAPVLNDSNGPGSEHGIGPGRGKGVGPGNGDGYGPGNDWGVGGDYPISGTNGYREVACTYCPAAQFSDEAVKAKFEGTVLISLIVTADGRATDVRVVRGLGMGLDEQAEAAVRKWRFTPSVTPGGKAAAVRALVEVVFHLY